MSHGTLLLIKIEERRLASTPARMSHAASTGGGLGALGALSVLGGLRVVGLGLLGCALVLMCAAGRRGASAPRQQLALRVLVGTYSILWVVAVRTLSLLIPLLPLSCAGRLAHPAEHRIRV